MAALIPISAIQVPQAKDRNRGEVVDIMSGAKLVLHQQIPLGLRSRLSARLAQDLFQLLRCDLPVPVLRTARNTRKAGKSPQHSPTKVTYYFIALGGSWHGTVVKTIQSGMIVPFKSAPKWWLVGSFLKTAYIHRPGQRNQTCQARQGPEVDETTSRTTLCWQRDRCITKSRF